LIASGSAVSTTSGSEPPADKPANRSYFPALDGLRALAFVMVFGIHYLQLPWGWAGVDVFFVLSGFLITGILFDTQDDPHRVRNFYIRRTLRIFPLYYGVMLVLVLLYPIFRWEWSWSWLVWPAYLGNFARAQHPFTFGSPLQRLADFQLVSRSDSFVRLFLGHCWSLCVEEQFYLIWPWVVFRVRDRKKLIYICVASVILCPLMRILGSHTLPQFMLNQEALYRWTPFRIDALLLGGLIALVRRGPSPRGLLIAARVVFAVLCVVITAWVLLNPSVRHEPDGYTYPLWRFTWGLSVIDLFAGCLIVMALEAGSATFRVFNLRPLRWIGRISYGAYVFHDIPHNEYYVLASNLKYPLQTTGPIVAFCGTLVLAWASYRYFESPFIRLKDRWTR